MFIILDKIKDEGVESIKLDQLEESILIYGRGKIKFIKLLLNMVISISFTFFHRICHTINY